LASNTLVLPSDEVSVAIHNFSCNRFPRDAAGVAFGSQRTGLDAEQPRRIALSVKRMDLF
jgi:hypothetical protein